MMVINIFIKWWHLYFVSNKHFSLQKSSNEIYDYVFFISSLFKKLEIRQKVGTIISIFFICIIIFLNNLKLQNIKLVYVILYKLEYPSLKIINLT